MRAGPCVGVTGTGDCAGSGWSPHWLAPLAWASQVESLVGSATVCPFCVVERAIAARVPGFNRQRVNRIKAILAGFNCMKNSGATGVGHCHLYDFVNETLGTARSGLPADGERGY